MTSPESFPRPVIVIGAGGGGIGTAITRGLAQAGTPVIAVDQDASRLRTLQDELCELPGSVDTEAADVTDSESVSALFQRIASSEVWPAGLVNVVGGLPAERWRSIVDDDDENLDALLDTNLRAAVRTSRAFARLQFNRQSDQQSQRKAHSQRDFEAPHASSIVQIATIAALEAMPFGAGYAASKAALLSYTRTMALEWGSAGIRVNAVAPGSILVPKNKSQTDPERDERIIPLGRRGTPEDVAGATLFLLGESSGWMTGQVLAVDGGVSIKPSYLDADGLPVFVQDEKIRSRLLS